MRDEHKMKQSSEDLNTEPIRVHRISPLSDELTGGDGRNPPFLSSLRLPTSAPGRLAIIAVTGTTRSVSMCRRPQPPPKPRSRPSSVATSHNTSSNVWGSHLEQKAGGPPAVACRLKSAAEMLEEARVIAGVASEMLVKENRGTGSGTMRPMQRDSLSNGKRLQQLGELNTAAKTEGTPSQTRLPPLAVTGVPKMSEGCTQLMNAGDSGLKDDTMEPLQKHSSSSTPVKKLVREDPPLTNVHESIQECYPERPRLEAQEWQPNQAGEEGGDQRVDQWQSGSVEKAEPDPSREEAAPTILMSAVDLLQCDQLRRKVEAKSRRGRSGKGSVACDGETLMEPHRILSRFSVLVPYLRRRQLRLDLTWSLARSEPLLVSLRPLPIHRSSSLPTVRDPDTFKGSQGIFRCKSDTMLAIKRQTKAIKSNPEDDKCLCMRVDTHEKKHDLQLAGYLQSSANSRMRSNMLKAHALHHLHISNWKEAMEAFTCLLELDPKNAMARRHRAHTYAKLGQFPEAVRDLSVALRLDPGDWQAFCLRGCLLRRSRPQQALKDLSTSLLINDGKENLSALLHRGVLYAELQQWLQATADFSAVIQLDRSVAVAHLSLGLIHLKQHQGQKAIRMFSGALKGDPTYLRGYLCRAHARWQVKDRSGAVKDVTRAIHVKPDAFQLYIIRGTYLCEMKRFDLATISIRYAEEMDKALGLSPDQHAALLSFRGNHSKAISCLLAHASINPSLQALVLLGKTQMKTSNYKDALESFQKALSLLPSHNLPEGADIFYQMGLCSMAEEQLLQAEEAFSSALKINPRHANAYHQRGICRSHLKHIQSLQDFNLAVTINPALFQVHLSRAAYYGAQGRYWKAVLCCNEAVKMQPSSVRAYLYRGALRFHMKMYLEAVEDCTTAVQLDHRCSLAYYNRAVCFHRLKEHKQALRDYSISLLDSRSGVTLKALTNRGLVYVELSDQHSALQDFKAAVKERPGDGRLHHALAVFHHRLGNLQESAQSYSLALRINPFSLEGYIGRGNVFMEYGHSQAYKQAQKDFVTALHLNQQCSSARICLGYNLQVGGCLQNAWHQFTVATHIEPRSWGAFEGRALVNLQMGRTYPAYQDINVAIRHNPNSAELYTHRGVINQSMGDAGSAMRDYQQAICLKANFSPALFNAANLYFYNKQFEQACQFYSRALEQDPRDVSALLNRAVTHTMLRKPTQALQDLNAGLELDPSNCLMLYNRAKLYCSLGQYHAAESDLTQALRFQPAHAMLHALRADVHAHLGSTRRALADYSLALHLQELQQEHRGFADLYGSGGGGQKAQPSFHFS